MLTLTFAVNCLLTSPLSFADTTVAGVEGGHFRRELHAVNGMKKRCVLRGPLPRGSEV